MQSCRPVLAVLLLGAALVAADCQNGTTLSPALPISVSGSNSLAPTSYVPSCQGTAHHSVWFAWTPNVSQQVTFSTRGSVFDTVLAVLDDPACHHEAKCNDDCCVNSTHSEINMLVTNGTLYRVVVAGMAEYASGMFNLTIAPRGPTAAPSPCPPSAATIPPLGGNSTMQQVMGSNANISYFPAMYRPGCQGKVTTTVYYSFTPSVTANYTLDTFGSTYDTVLVMFDDAWCQSEAACSDDDVNFPPQSLVSLAMQANVTYRVLVAGFQNSYGLHVLRVHFADQYVPPAQNVSVFQIPHGLCYGAYCECDPGFSGSGCNATSLGAGVTRAPAAGPTRSPSAAPSWASSQNAPMPGLIVALIVLGLLSILCACGIASANWLRTQRASRVREEDEALGFGKGRAGARSNPRSPEHQQMAAT